MPYIAYLDMLGTRASASMSNQEYTDAITDFHNALKQLSDVFDCEIYGYSDNAYIQIEHLSEMIDFLRQLRRQLMMTHRYFSASLNRGSLNTTVVKYGSKKGLSMQFTAPAVIELYLSQCQFSGIGFSISQNVCDDMENNGIGNLIGRSVYKKLLPEDFKNSIVPVKDIAYESILIEDIDNLVSDYVITASTDERAARYYLTPIVSMLKSVDLSVIEADNSLDKLISLISFDSLPDAFKTSNKYKEYSFYFLFSLLDYVFSLSETNRTFDSWKISEKILKKFDSDFKEIIEHLTLMPINVISGINKRKLIVLIYNMNRQNQGGTCG